MNLWIYFKKTFLLLNHTKVLLKVFVTVPRDIRIRKKNYSWLLILIFGKSFSFSSVDDFALFNGIYMLRVISNPNPTLLLSWKLFFFLFFLTLLSLHKCEIVSRLDIFCRILINWIIIIWITILSTIFLSLLFFQWSVLYRFYI